VRSHSWLQREHDERCSDASMLVEALGSEILEFHLSTRIRQATV
jgi:hypothetical protein